MVSDLFNESRPSGAAREDGRPGLRIANRGLVAAWRCLLCALLLGTAPSSAVAADAGETVATRPRVVVVLAGGGARGFAHLSLLRRLERDHVPIHRIVGTSMGAVIGGLYATGLAVDEIEQVIGSLDPAKVALDQVGRSELPAAQRSYQGQYPIGLELGVNDQGQLGFARGASDGQRFLGLLQRLTAHVPPGTHFDQLRVPFRAVATRYRDGEIKVFEHGDLHLAIRASMAAPGVFAPAVVDGETYVDGGLVANLPVEVALQEGADVVVASYLGAAGSEQSDPANALASVTRMIDILIRQNERRSLSALRPQDILVHSRLPGVEFADFEKAAQVVALGDLAVQEQAPRFEALAARVATTNAGAARTAIARPSAFDQREVVVSRVSVQGQRHVPQAYVARRFLDLVGVEFDAHRVGARVDALYTEGLFERVHYALQPLQDRKYELVVIVEEKPYGPNLLRPILSLYTDRGANQLFSLGVGYRRRFLTESGLEVQAQVRVGAPTELSAQLLHPLWDTLRFGAELGARQSNEPVYLSPEPAKLGYGIFSSRSLGANLEFEWGRYGLVRAGVARRLVSERLDTSLLVSVNADAGALGAFELPELSYRFNAVNMQFVSDLLDSVTFPTEGHFFNLDLERGVGGARYARLQANLRGAVRHGRNVMNVGLNLGSVVSPTCEGERCLGARQLSLGGFQAMGAFSAGQLSGNRLAHGHITYMRRFEEGGVLRQPMYFGVVGELGDAWDTSETRGPKLRGSLTAFFGIDSKLGEFYLAAARGSQNNRNLFMQLGRRFEVW